MSSRTSVRKQEEEDEGASYHIRWINVIFLPFYPVFQLIVSSSVILKCVLGPLQGVYPYILCTDLMDQNRYLSPVKYMYVYFADLIYGIDTFLHIAHRQVTEEAMRREHLPKSAVLLILDIVSLIPFFKLFTTESCPPSQFYPNIFSFSESVILYRVVEYFNWSMTHSPCMILICFILMSALVVNCFTCFFLLLTIQGLCTNCHNSLYDWRSYVFYRFNETDYDDISTYIYGTSFTLSFLVHNLVDELKPNTINCIILSIAFMVIGYILYVFVFLPKIFAESVLSIRRICSFHVRVSRIIDETKMRNPSPKAYRSVEDFYTLIWEKRKGITSIPSIISELPSYLRIEIRQDLVWPVFYHSPTFRNTSKSYKRWLCEHIHLDYKLPGERLYVGPHCHTNLYYLKSGIVQLISSDDSTSPLLSVSGGTIFGDISFALPPYNRRVIVRCLTYCEVFIISRSDILKSLHKFPKDRNLVMKNANGRISHAHALYNCKQHVRGLDRSEDEGIAWLKRRWWQISEVLTLWRTSKKKNRQRCELPPEESSYHCAKYIGQLVLCSNVQLQRNSLFANVEFPWILLPHSTFGTIWNKIVIFTVSLVLVLYPPNLARPVTVLPNLFLVFQYYVNLIYITDIIVSLMTAVDNQGNMSTSFSTVLFSRFKCLYFILDVLSTIWIEKVMILIGLPDLYLISQFNRLIKVYMLFTDKYCNEWKKKKKPIVDVFSKIFLIWFCYMYALAYFFYIIAEKCPTMSIKYLFGPDICSQKETNSTYCTTGVNNVLKIAVAWLYESIYNDVKPSSFLDVCIGILLSVITYMLFIYTGTICLASFYLKYRDMYNYHYFVSNLKKHFVHYMIHPDLLKRLNRFLVCHWKYFHGMDIMKPTLLKNEPYDIYWKLHGETAEKIIGDSRAFAGANPSLIKDLAHKAKFLIIPRDSTLILFGIKCKNVNWIVHGRIKCEYHNEAGELLKKILPLGQMLSLGSVFLGKASLRTYTAATDCEMLFITEKDFFTTVKHYPNEWSFFETCIKEVSPMFQDIFLNYVKKHRDYQRKLRAQKLLVKRSVAVQTGKEKEKTIDSPAKTPWYRNVLNHITTEPESRFIRFWLLFRAIFVAISIICTSLQGGIGAFVRWPLGIIVNICDLVSLMDIILKLLLPYYDVHGLVISDLRKRMLHYGTRGLIMDIIGILPWSLLSSNSDENEALLLDTISKFAHIYLVIGYFDYIADSPTVNYAFVMIVKWHVFTFLLTMGTSHYFVSKCITFEWDKSYRLVNMQKCHTCWHPPYMLWGKNITAHDLHIIFAQSLNLAQSGLTRIDLGSFFARCEKSTITMTLILLGVFFWCVMCLSQTLLMLSYRSNTLVQHGVHQLIRFLKAERVDKALIDRAESHFTYWWIRTKGLHINSLINERIGVVFRQDLSYFFYKKTFLALDTLIHGGEGIARQLSGVLIQIYNLPGEDIMREMDLVSYVYVVHRGRVSISRHGKQLAILTKGSIFGQLEGLKARPIRTTAKAVENTDLLQIPIKQFQESINDDVRGKISQHHQTENDFIALKKPIVENPYNTIQYILRGRKTIWLPRMTAPMEAQFNNLYYHWLFCVWLVEPVITAVLVLTQKTLPTVFKGNLTWGLVLLDLLHLAHIVVDFYSICHYLAPGVGVKNLLRDIDSKEAGYNMEDYCLIFIGENDFKTTKNYAELTQLVVREDKCVHQFRRLRRLAEWDFYFNVISLLMPLLTPLTGNWDYQLMRLLRLHSVYYFYIHFCQNLQSKTMPIIVRLIIMFLLMHALTCGWMVIGCRREKGEPFPVQTFPLPDAINKTLDPDEWVTTDKRINGCPRISKAYLVNRETRYGFIVPKHWEADYILALAYIVVLYTHTNMDLIVPLSIEQIYFKIFMNAVLCMVEMWLTSVAISAIYTKLRDLYLYDYHVASLVEYLNHNGLTRNLVQSVQKYTTQLWARQRGYWLPEITQQAPVCLREDLFGVLYMHHLETPSLFQNLPSYVKRQLAAKLNRVVIFPGNSIVREGDIYPSIYFIHEGEVEKWFTDASGESKMVSLLLNNGYFGLIPCLFPDTPFEFTYSARTVVDLVYLKHKDLQDLLDGYPGVRFNVYSAALKLKRMLKK